MISIPIDNHPPIKLDELTPSAIRKGLSKWVTDRLQPQRDADFSHVLNPVLEKIVINKAITLSEFNELIDTTFEILAPYVTKNSKEHYLVEYCNDRYYKQMYILTKYDEHGIFTVDRNVRHGSWRQEMHNPTLSHDIFRIHDQSNKIQRAIGDLGIDMMTAFHSFIARRIYYSLHLDKPERKINELADVFRYFADYNRRARYNFAMWCIKNDLKKMDPSLDIDCTIPRGKIQGTQYIRYVVPQIYPDVQFNDMAWYFDIFLDLGVDMMDGNCIVDAIFKYIEKPIDLFNIYMDYIGNDKEIYNVRADLVNIIRPLDSYNISLYVINAHKRGYITVDDIIDLTNHTYGNDMLLAYIIQSTDRKIEFNITSIVSKCVNASKTLLSILNDDKAIIDNNMLDSTCSVRSLSVIGREMLINNEEYYIDKMERCSVDKLKSTDEFTLFARIYDAADTRTKAMMYTIHESGEKYNQMYDLAYITSNRPTITHQYLMAMAMFGHMDLVRVLIRIYCDYGYIMDLLNDEIADACCITIQKEWIHHVIEHGIGHRILWAKVRNPTISIPHDLPDHLVERVAVKKAQPSYISFDVRSLIDRKNQDVGVYQKIKDLKIDYDLDKKSKWDYDEISRTIAGLAN